MAKPGETAQIFTKKQYDWFARALKHGLTKEFMPRRAGRNEDGDIVSAGGGTPHNPPEPGEAKRVLDAFHASGLDREDLPDSTGSRETARNRDRRPTVSRGRLISPARRPDGSGTLEKRWQAGRASRQPATPPKKKKKKWLNRYLNREENLDKYLSKSISEDFDSSLDKALGI